MNSRTPRIAWGPPFALLLAAAADVCLAQSATPGSTITLDPVVVVGTQEASETASVEERFHVLPGGVALVPQEEIPQTANPTASRALSGVPGVVVQDFFGGNDQPRIQMRGSGLQQNPVERGILVLQNGLPLNRADGSYIVGFANPHQAESIEVYRGYMANRLGATVLGGALNFVSPTGASQPETELSVAGGSFGQIGGSVQTGFKRTDMDGLIGLDVNRRDGFRDYNSSERVSVDANIGLRHSEHVSTRFFAGYTDLDFDVAGPLTWDGLRADPRRVHGGPTLVGGVAVNPGPNVLRDRPRREANQYLVGARTTASFDAHLLDVALGYTRTDDTFRFPISSGIRMTEGGDVTGVARYAYNPAAAILPLAEFTAQITTGSADRVNYINQGGARGARFGESHLHARTLSLHAGLNLPLAEWLTLSPALSYARATRDNDDTYGLATRPTIAYSPANPTMLLPNGAVPAQSTSYARSYSGWSPSLAVTYRPDEIHTVFVAVSRSFEPPTHDDLLATVNGTPNSSPGRPMPGNPGLAAAVFATPDLEAQRATTVETGWRGRTTRLSWDAVTYFSWVDHELLSLRDATGAPLGAVNADETTHFGIELGIGATLAPRLLGRITYTYQDFRFVDDPLRGDNRLAGAPRHLVNAMLQFQVSEAWLLGGAVRWVPARTPVDNMNTLYADSYVVVDLRTGYRINDKISIFGEITNLFDEKYASSTLVVDEARPDQAAFLPGDGRGFFAGVNVRF
ncbi:MAG: TonB-dependent receptor [Burkholderiales bacterium]|nr:TonB-dependent receptor [Burkholderiales bacterium]